ncbi:MAG: hypothetical protein AAF846_19375 [Chloroflexota bacterium]
MVAASVFLGGAIVAFNIAFWCWQPLLLVIGGAIAVAWLLGYRIGNHKSKR